MPATPSAIFRIIAIASLAHAVFVSARVGAALYALKRHDSALWVGALLALFAVAPLFTAVRAGRWIDRSGGRAPLVWALALLWIGCALPAFTPQGFGLFPALILSSILIGTGQMLALIAVQHWLGEQAGERERIRMFSWLSLGIALASIAGPLISGALIDTLGYRAIYQTLVLAATIAAALLWRNLQLLPCHAKALPAAVPKPALDLLRYPMLRKVLLAAILVSMSWDLQSVMVPLHGHAVGLAAVSVGFILSSFAVATLIVRAIMPWLVGRWPAARILGLTMASAAMAFAIFPLFSSLPGLVATAFLLGLGLGAAQPGIMSLLYEHTPVGRGAESLGLRTTLMNGTHVALPLLLGAGAGAVGHRAIFWSLALLLAWGAASTWRKLSASEYPPDRTDTKVGS